MHRQPDKALPSSTVSEAAVAYRGAVMLSAWQDMAFWLATVGVAYVIHFFPFEQLLESLAGG